MVHTAELSKQITQKEYNTFVSDKNTVWIKAEKHNYTLARYGIRDVWVSRQYIKSAGITVYFCILIINLERVKNNGQKAVSTYGNGNGFEMLKKNFGMYVGTILPCHTDINGWSLNRIDYNIDIKMEQENVERYISLLQKGGKHFSWKTYGKTNNGNKKHPVGSVRYKNNQYTVNIYDKYMERQEEQKRRGITDTEELKASKGVLRVEIQVKETKLNSIKQQIKGYFDFVGKPIELFARHEIAYPMIMRTVESIAVGGHYTTLKEAEKAVHKQVKCKRTANNIVDFLHHISKSQSLWRAKETYTGELSISTIMKYLNRLQINPVTIPARWGCNGLVGITELTAQAILDEMEQAKCVHTMGEIE